MLSFGAGLLLTCLCFLQQIDAHISGTRKPNVCVNISTSEKRYFNESDERILTFTKVSPTKTPVLKAFAGEKRALRCIQSKKRENIGWFISKTSPFSRATMSRGLVRVPEESSCYRIIHQTNQNITINILEVLVQKETIGFFTCAEETPSHTDRNPSIWSALEVYLIAMYEPAVEVYNLSLHAIADSCEQAKALLNESSVIGRVPYLQLKHPLIMYYWGETTCSNRSNSDPCYKPTGRDGQSVPNDEAFWSRTKLAEKLQFTEDDDKMIPLVIVGEHMRIRLKDVNIYETGGFVFDFVDHSTTHEPVEDSLDYPEVNQNNTYQYKDCEIMASVALAQETVCPEVWDSTLSFVHFDYIILELMLSYMELPGGIRVPFSNPLEPVDLRETRGLRIKAISNSLNPDINRGIGYVIKGYSQKQTIDSIYYETPTRAEDLLERMVPRGEIPEPRVQLSECDQNSALTRHQTSICQNLPPSCFDDARQKQFKIKVLHDVSYLPISIKPASSLITVDSLLRLSDFDGPYYEFVFLVKEVKTNQGYYINVLRILWEKGRVRLITLDKGPKSELTLPLPGPVDEIQQSRMDILLSQGMRNITVSFRLNDARRVTDNIWITPPEKGSIELHYRTRKQTACMECFLCIHVDNRGAYLASTEAIRRRWERTKRSPLSVDLNRNSLPLVGEKQSHTTGHAQRMLMIHNSMWPNYTNIPSARILERLRHYNARKQVTLLVHNVWLQCPPGYYVALIQPPSCLPCPPRTQMHLAWSGDGRPDGPYCAACNDNEYQLNPGSTSCRKCNNEDDMIAGVEYCGRTYKGRQPQPPPRRPRPPSRKKPESVLPVDDQIRRSSVPTYGAIFWMFTCVMGLLTLVIYFFLEGTGFILSRIARGKRRRRPPPRRKRGKQQYLTEMAIFRDIPIQTEESWICSHGVPHLRQELILLRDLGIQTDAPAEGDQAKGEKEEGVKATDADLETAGRSNKSSGRAEVVSRPSQTR